MADLRCFSLCRFDHIDMSTAGRSFDDREIICQLPAGVLFVFFGQQLEPGFATVARVNIDNQVARTQYPSKSMAGVLVDLRLCCDRVDRPVFRNRPFCTRFYGVKDNPKKILKEVVLWEDGQELI